MSRCYNGGEKHKFEPRYDEIPISSVEYRGHISPKSLRKLTIRNVYLGDICVWCGKVIKRGK